ncbi:MAG: hypothetical protein CVU09_10790 [Bacteroidetes bacterium HGW-Bacteroidetes-4]|nr:MAG: hypothetical protein CVU09_10790 [Bacteroidetes bacterium HGW-Bacteroidetes-4]
MIIRLSNLQYINNNKPNSFSLFLFQPGKTKQESAKTNQTPGSKKIFMLKYTGFIKYFYSFMILF